MTEQQNKIEAQIAELISSKIAADDVDSGWAVACIMVALALPVLKDIASNLEAISAAIAPDEAGRSVGAELRSIFHVLEELTKKGLRR